MEPAGHLRGSYRREGAGDVAAFFLFVRAVSREQVTDRDLTAGLLMTTPSGKVLCEPSVDREHTRRDDDDGWVAFSADVACRTIFLKYTGEPARTVPIHFDPGWETQLFLLHHGRPRFETMKFFMVGKGAGFQANDEVARNVDLALTGLQNRTNLLPRPVMDDLLNGKFRNPIEGLIGATSCSASWSPTPSGLTWCCGTSRASCQIPQTSAPWRFSGPNA